MKELWAAFGQAVAWVALIVGNLVLDGWVLKTLWGWFVVPRFSLAPLNITSAIGLSLVIGLVTYQYNGHDSSKERVAWSVAMPVLLLVVGWCVHLFQ
jgi:hypothetical protein